MNLPEENSAPLAVQLWWVVFGNLEGQTIGSCVAAGYDANSAILRAASLAAAPEGTARARAALLTKVENIPDEKLGVFLRPGVGPFVAEAEA